MGAIRELIGLVSRDQNGNVSLYEWDVWMTVLMISLIAPNIGLVDISNNRYFKMIGIRLYSIWYIINHQFQIDPPRKSRDSLYLNNIVNIFSCYTDIECQCATSGDNGFSHVTYHVICQDLISCVQDAGPGGVLTTWGPVNTVCETAALPMISEYVQHRKYVFVDTTNSRLFSVTVIGQDLFRYSINHASWSRRDLLSNIW